MENNETAKQNGNAIKGVQGFQPGLPSANPRGRPKNDGRPLPSEIRKTVREGIDLLFANELPKLQEKLALLSNKDYCDFMIRLMEYYMPKLNRTMLDVTPETAQLIRTFSLGVPITPSIDITPDNESGH